MTALPQTVVCQVPFRRRVRQRGEITASSVEAAPEVPAGRVPRIARLMALALRFEQLVRGGEIKNYAELARLDIGQAQPQIMRAEIPPLVQSTGGGAPSCPCPTASQAPSKKDRLLAELARIVAVADAVDAMTSDRSYRR